MGARASYGVRQHRERRRRFVRQNWRYLAGLLLSALVQLTSLVLDYRHPSTFAGFMVGASVMLLVFAAIGMFFAASPGSFAMRVGNYAERYVGRELRKHPEVLAMVSTVEFEKFDIDHVIVTRAAVFAVEVKYRSSVPGQQRLGRDVAQLAEEVRKARLLLMSNGIRDLPVKGLLVYWGACPAVVQAGPVAIDPTTVVLHINDLGPWLHEQDDDSISRPQAVQIAAGIERYAQLRADTVRREHSSVARS